MLDKQIDDNFLGSCRNLYKSGIYPFSVAQYDSLAYRQHQTLAQRFIQQEGLQTFLGNLIEHQYYVNLWAAIFALEFGLPSVDEELEITKGRKVVEFCLDTVKSHFPHPPQPGNSIRTASADIWLTSMRRYYSINDL